MGTLIAAFVAAAMAFVAWLTWKANGGADRR